MTGYKLFLKKILDLDLPGTGMSFSDLDQANLSSRRKTKVWKCPE
jgi:hypothetical protein